MYWRYRKTNYQQRIVKWSHSYVQLFKMRHMLELVLILCTSKIVCMLLCFKLSWWKVFGQINRSLYVFIPLHSLYGESKLKCVRIIFLLIWLYMYSRLSIATEKNWEFSSLYKKKHVLMHCCFRKKKNGKWAKH